MTASSPTPLTGYAGVLNHREAEHHFNIPFAGEKISTYSCVVIGQILFAKLVQACPQRRSITIATLNDRHQGDSIAIAKLNV